MGLPHPYEGQRDPKGPGGGEREMRGRRQCRGHAEALSKPVVPACDHHLWSPCVELAGRKSSAGAFTEHWTQPLHLTEEETEAQGGDRTCPRTHCQSVEGGLGREPTSQTRSLALPRVGARSLSFWGGGGLRPGGRLIPAGVRRGHLKAPRLQRG